MYGTPSITVTVIEDQVLHRDDQFLLVRWFQPGTSSRIFSRRRAKIFCQQVRKCTMSKSPSTFDVEM